MNANDLLTAEPHMNANDKRLRDKFVAEYLKDYHTINAAIRMNYAADGALNFAKMMWEDAYVQRQIAHYQQSRCTWMRAPDGSNNDNTVNEFGQDKQADKQRIINQLFKEMYNTGAGGTQKGRIAAATALARIYNLDQVDEVGANTSNNVMIVPEVASVEEWAAMAKKSQAKLKEQVKQ